MSLITFIFSCHESTIHFKFEDTNPTEMKHIACLILLMAVTAHASDQSPNMQEGLWEYKTITSIRDAGQFPPQEETITECLTADQIVTGEAFLDDVEACNVAKNTMTSERMEVYMVCPADNGTTLDMSMQMNFNGTEAQGLIVTHANTDVGGIVIEVKMHGKRLGDCPE